MEASLEYGIYVCIEDVSASRTFGVGTPQALGAALSDEELQRKFDNVSFHSNQEEEWTAEHESRRKNAMNRPFTPRMHEVDSELIHRAWKVLVDSRDACAIEVGELIAAGKATDSNANLIKLGLERARWGDYIQVRKGRAPGRGYRTSRAVSCGKYGVRVTNRVLPRMTSMTGTMSLELSSTGLWVAGGYCTRVNHIATRCLGPSGKRSQYKRNGELIVRTVAKPERDTDTRGTFKKLDQTPNHIIQPASFEDAQAWLRFRSYPTWHGRVDNRAQPGDQQYIAISTADADTDAHDVDPRIDPDFNLEHASLFMSIQGHVPMDDHRGDEVVYGKDPFIHSSTSTAIFERRDGGRRTTLRGAQVLCCQYHSFV
ncbi:hypothetical protein EV363DRAFT_1416566 [Boletus edulis]|nr:hypothetical protein EV363DRAFT_1416566 [Boletus edulis]